jgi:hypothetical protein
MYKKWFLMNTPVCVQYEDKSDFMPDLAGGSYVFLRIKP